MTIDRKYKRIEAIPEKLDGSIRAEEVLDQITKRVVLVSSKAWLDNRLRAYYQQYVQDSKLNIHTKHEGCAYYILLYLTTRADYRDAPTVSTFQKEPLSF